MDNKTLLKANAIIWATVLGLAAAIYAGAVWGNEIGKILFR